jgi:hypothetical protein
VTCAVAEAPDAKCTLLLLHTISQQEPLQGFHASHTLHDKMNPLKSNQTGSINAIAVLINCT